MNCRAILRTILIGALLALAGACGSDHKGNGASPASSSTGGAATTVGGTSSAGGSATGGGTTPTGGAGGVTATGGASGGNETGGEGGANATGGSGGVSPICPAPATDCGQAGGAVAGGAPNGPYLYFVTQSAGAGKTTASVASGVISVSSAYSASGNAFKYQAPNYYGTNSNGFIAFPTTMSGDFSIAAEVNITKETKSNNACGVGLGMTSGFPSGRHGCSLADHGGSRANRFGRACCFAGRGA